MKSPPKSSGQAGFGVRPKPFLKWAGGKRAILAELIARLPDRIEHYIEPFLGGGALFFELARQRQIGTAVLNDRNPELIATWRAVRSDAAGVCRAARQWSNDEETYYQVRAASLADPIEAAARVVWLNRHCFNGLYRINQKGGFNVPYGRYKSTRIDEDNLLACSEALAAVELRSEDFESIMAGAPRGAVLYCDPPYWPLSETSSFTAYDGFPFTSADQRRLAAAFHALPARGARGLLSNSSTPDTHGLYDTLDLRLVQVRRSINRDVNGRGEVDEILVGVGDLPGRRDHAEAHRPRKRRRS